MSQDTFQLTLNAAEVYESQKVPAMFRPLAEATLREVSINSNDLVLDAACGTGIVSRLIEERVPNINCIVGVDLNKGMIEVAQTLTKDRQGLFEWHQADILTLPFEDNTFTIAFCQQGLQFFPSKVEALSEIRRVLGSDGRLVLTVWSEISPFFEALAESLKANITNSVAERSLAPFEFRDGQVIEQLISNAGFVDIRSDTITVERKMGPASISIPKEIAGNPVGPEVAEKGQDVIDQIVKEVGEALRPYQKEDGFVVPQSTHLIQALA